MIKIYTCLEIYDKLLTNSDNVLFFIADKRQKWNNMKGVLGK